MDQSHTKRKELLVIGAFSTPIVAKRNVLRSASRYSKVQGPAWTPLIFVTGIA